MTTLTTETTIPTSENETSSGESPPLPIATPGFTIIFIIISMGTILALKMVVRKLE